MVPLVWGPEQFRAYLNIFHNIDLNKYLDPFFNRDLIIMSPKTALQSKSDVDGDLAPSMILNSEGQVLVKQFINKTTPAEELAWLDDYAKKEYESDLKLNINGKHKYTLYTINNKFDITGIQSDNYAQYLLNSTIAKGNIGSATIDCWIIKLLFQCYNALFDKNKGFIYDNNGNEIGRMRFKLSAKDSNYLAHVYTRLVQERVVEGIKHQSGGSTAFQIYFLKEITNKKNQEIVKHQLEHDFKVPVVMISKLLEVIEYCVFDKALLKACQNFISKYNKGTLPKDPKPLETWETFIQESTFFGLLVKPLFEVNRQIKDLQGNQYNTNTNLNLSELDLISSKDSLESQEINFDDFSDISF